MSTKSHGLTLNASNGEKSSKDKEKFFLARTRTRAEVTQYIHLEWTYPVGRRIEGACLEAMRVQQLYFLSFFFLFF